MLKKHEKDLKPVSLRVRDAAELLLTCLVEEIGSVPISFSSQSVDENFLLRASGKETKSDLKLDTKPFRFFASEGTVYSILENSCQGFGQGLCSDLKTACRLSFSFYGTLPFNAFNRFGTSYYYIVEKCIRAPIMDIPNASFAST